MPSIGDQPIPIFLDAIPYEIPRPYKILTRPGMAGASVLFSARQFVPLTIRTRCSALTLQAAYALSDAFLRKIRSRVKIDDGMTYADGTVVLNVSTLISDAGLIIGGNAEGDRYAVDSTWTFLLDADRDER